MIQCNHCKAHNNEGQKFCGHCGSALNQGCTTCGAQKMEGHKFCGQCGTSYEATTMASAPLTQTRNPIPAGPANQAPMNNPSIHPLAPRVKILTEKYRLYCEKLLSGEIEVMNLDSKPNHPWIQFFTNHPGGESIGAQNILLLLGGSLSQEAIFSEAQNTFSASGNDSFFPALEVHQVDKTKEYIVVYFLIPRNEAALYLAKMIAFVEARLGINDSDWKLEAE